MIIREGEPQGYWLLHRIRMETMLHVREYKYWWESEHGPSSASTREETKIRDVLEPRDGCLWWEEKTGSTWYKIREHVEISTKGETKGLELGRRWKEEYRWYTRIKIENRDQRGWNTVSKKGNTQGYLEIEDETRARWGTRRGRGEDEMARVRTRARARTIE